MENSSNAQDRDQKSTYKKKNDRNQPGNKRPRNNNQNYSQNDNNKVTDPKVIFREISNKILGIF